MGVPAQSCEHLYSSLLWLLPLEPQKSPRKPSPPLFQEVVAGLLEELRLLLVSSLIRLLSLEVESGAPSCAEDPWLPPIWLSQPVTPVMDNLPAVLESVLETTTSMKMILIRWTLLFPRSCFMRITIPGPLRTTSVFWNLKARLTSAAPLSDLSLFLPQWRNTPLELTAPFLDGAPACPGLPRLAPACPGLPRLAPACPGL